MNFHSDPQAGRGDRMTAQELEAIESRAFIGEDVDESPGGPGACRECTHPDCMVARDAIALVARVRELEAERDREVARHLHFLQAQGGLAVAWCDARLSQITAENARLRERLAGLVTTIEALDKKDDSLACTPGYMTLRAALTAAKGVKP